MDSSERGAGDLSPASGSGLLAATPGLLPCGHRDAAPLPAARGGVHRPKEPQVRHEAAVGDLGVRAAFLFPFVLAPAGSLSRRDMRRPCGPIQSLSPVCDKDSWRGGCESSFLFHDITDALISNCDQLNDCPNLDLNRCLDFCFDCVVKSLSLQHAVKQQQKNVSKRDFFFFLLLPLLLL